MRSLAAVIAVLCASSLACATASEGPTTQVSADVFLVRSYSDHRVIITRTCNSSHCYTRGILETTSGRGENSSIERVPITELEEHWWSFVTDVVPSSYPDVYFDLIAEDTHGTNAGFTMRLLPQADGSYRSEMLEFRSGADL